MIYNVTYRVSETIWSSNVAIAENEDDVRAHYSSKADTVIISEGSEHDVRNAQERGKPVVTCPPAPQPAPQPEPAETETASPAEAEPVPVHSVSVPALGAEPHKKPKNLKVSRAGDDLMAAMHQAIRNAEEEYRTSGRVTICISNTNNKTETPSFSTLPVICCPAICRGTCDKDCYAEAMIRRHGVRPDNTQLVSWARNLVAWRHDPDAVFAAIMQAQQASPFFRYHVSGDILGEDYLRRMADAAEQVPSCRSLAFTKCYGLVDAWIDEHGPLPENLVIRPSEGWGIQYDNPHHLPTSICYGTEDEIPAGKGVYHCTGFCPACQAAETGCWYPNEDTRTVAFAKH